MTLSRRFAVITTIQEPTPAVRTLVERLEAFDAELLVIGDRKGPTSFECQNSHFVSAKDQASQLEFEICKHLPFNSYARKNLGYLIAMSMEAGSIYETDDDNLPNEGWSWRNPEVMARRVMGEGWANVYHYFSKDWIWPRGLPLEELEALKNNPRALGDHSESVYSPIQQGLASESPDVDAIWRLVFFHVPQLFHSESIYLPPGVWSPFNSQSTWWFPSAFPLMYLPSFASFRMTDIWRGLIAQRCLWELGFGLVFHSPEVRQERNAHDLLVDFEQEVPGYLGNQGIRLLLEDISLDGGHEQVANNLLKCYRVLTQANHLPSQELRLVECWVEDILSMQA